MTSRAGPPQGVQPTRDVLQPALNPATIKYHSISRQRLVESTEQGLAAAGVLPTYLGARDGLNVTLTGCISLSEHARQRLPTDLGGRAGGLFGPSDTDGSPPRIRAGGASPTYRSSPTPSHEPQPGATVVDVLRRAATSAAAAEATRAAATDALASARAAQERVASLRSRTRAADATVPDDDLTTARAARDLATAAAARTDHEARIAEDEADTDAAAVLSSLGSPTSPRPTPTPSAFLGTDASRDQQNLVTSVTALAQTNDAVSTLMSYL